MSYFDGIKVGDEIWDLIEHRHMRVSEIITEDYFPLILRGDSEHDRDSCTMEGFDGVHQVKRYYWTILEIVGGNKRN